VDLPGHGRNAGISASLDETTDLLANVLPPIHYMGGYSFGARVALHFTLRYPDRVRALVVLGATRGITTSATAKRGDEAMKRSPIESNRSRRRLPRRMARAKDVRLTAEGPTRARRAKHRRRGLANSLRFAGTGTQRWLAPELASLEVPTLALAGASTRSSPSRRRRSPKERPTRARQFVLTRTTPLTSSRPKQRRRSSRLHRPILNTSTTASNAPSCNWARAEYFNIGKSSRPFLFENARRTAGM